VFAIENNQYAMGTAVRRSSAETEFYRRGTAFRIPAWTSNGMDVLEVRQGRRSRLRPCARRQRAGAARTQYLPLSRPLDVRSGQIPDREEVENVREHNDPIERAKAELIALGSTRTS
jgi:pyruvate dehydrogenase E1 component alpha subunit